MSWLRQRTRWLKGFVQTWLVHMRAPRRLWRDLGPHGFFAFQIMIGGTVLSALVHPWFYLLLAAEAVGGRFLSLPASVFGVPFWTVAWFDLVAGYLAAMALALLAARRRRLFRLILACSLDAALLAPDLGGGLPGPLAIRDRALQMGKDRARSVSRNPPRNSSHSVQVRCDLFVE